MIYSSIPYLDPPMVEEDSLVIVAAKPGTLSQDESGKVYQLTESALISGAPSWVGGRIRVNHEVTETGTITESWYDNGLKMRISGLSSECRDVINSSAYRGVSQESEALELGEEIVLHGRKVTPVTSVRGLGVSVIVYPVEPACPLSEGCGIPLESNAPILNFDLNNNSKNITVDKKGGPSMDEPVVENKIDFENIMKENQILKDQVEELKVLIQKQPEELEKAVTGALASQAIKIKEEAERDKLVVELKSCMPVGFEEFMSVNPNNESISGMVTAMRKAYPVGGSGGSVIVQSSIPVKLQEGTDIYRKLGLSVEDVAKYEV
jgi:hypothetical protein